MQWQRLYNPLVLAVLRSPLHRLLSGSVMEIAVLGRKTGLTYSIPVQYVRRGEGLLVISQRHRTWWRNLRGGFPVGVRLQGRQFHGRGEPV